MQLSNKQWTELLFFVRTELIIDSVPLTEEDLVDTLNNSLTAKELLERLLGNNDWENLVKEAHDAALDTKDIEDLLLSNNHFSSTTITCSNCSWRGEPEELEIDLDEEVSSNRYCPDCGKSVKLTQ